MSNQIHSAVQSSAKFLKNLLKRKQNVFTFSKEGSKVLKQVMNYFSKEQSVLLINEDENSVYYKQVGDSTFKDITAQLDIIQTIQSSKKLDYVILNGLSEKDYFSMLTYVYQENIGLIANFKEESSNSLLAYFDWLTDEEVKKTFPHLDKNYFLSKTLPMVVECEESIDSIKALHLNSYYEVISENVFVRGEEGLQWTGIYPPYFLMKNVDLQELEKKKYFNGDKELHNRLKDSLFDKLRGIATTYYVPVTKEVENNHSIQSYYGGAAMASSEVGIPLCKTCHTQMSLVVQVDLENVPPAISDSFGMKDGYLQLFTCNNDDSDCMTHSARLLKASEAVEDCNAEHSIIMDRKAIVEWTECFEKPSPKTLKEGNVVLTKEDKSFMKWYYEQSKVVDKFGGKPEFIQYNPRLKCPISKKPMKFIMQIESYFNLENFNGRIYLYQSPEHKDVLSVYWDCD